MGSIVQSRFSQIDDSCSRILPHIGSSMISIGTRQDQDIQAAKNSEPFLKFSSPGQHPYSQS